MDAASIQPQPLLTAAPPVEDKSDGTLIHHVKAIIAARRSSPAMALVIWLD